MAEGTWRVQHSSEDHTHATPSAFVAWVESSTGRSFDLDACAIPETAVAPKFFSPEVDALQQDWASAGRRVWCNPPYGRGIGDWLEKGLEASRGITGSDVFYLLYARTDTKWWHHYVPKASTVWFLKGRIKFIGNRDGAPAPSVLLHFGGPQAAYIGTVYTHRDWKKAVPPFERWREGLQRRASSLIENVSAYY